MSTLTGCVSISDYASLVGIPIWITSSTIELKNCVITAGIKKYKSIIKKKEMKHHKIVLLAKSQLNRIEVLISKALIDSNLVMTKSLYDIMYWKHFMIRKKKSEISVTLKT